MRRLVVPLIALAVLLGAEGAARVVARSLPPPTDWPNPFLEVKAERIEALSTEGVDVVFVGSSVTQADLDPGLFAERSSRFDSAYNAGIPSASPRVWRLFLDDTVHRHLCPDLVVVGVDIRQYNDNQPGSDRDEERYQASPGRERYVTPDADVSFADRAEEWVERNSALFRLRGRFREPDKLFAWATGIGTIGGWSTGTVPADGRFRGFDSIVFEPPPTGLDRLRRTAFRDFEVGGVEEDSLVAIAAAARERGSAVVMVIMPALYADMTPALPGGVADVAAFRASVASAADRAGVPLLVFPHLENRPELFADLYHMNGAGSEALTVALAEATDALDPGGAACGHSR